MTQILTPFFRLTSPGRPSYPPWHSRWSRSTMDRSSSSFPFRGIVLTFKEYIIDAMPLLCQKNNLSTKKSEPESVGFADFGISTVCFSCAFLFKFIPRLSLLCLPCRWLETSLKLFLTSGQKQLLQLPVHLNKNTEWKYYWTITESNIEQNSR